MRPSTRAGIALIVVALSLTLFQLGEDSLVGGFFISRQALWNGGTSYVKLTLLSVLFTFVAVGLAPYLTITGLLAFVRGAQSPAAPPGGAAPPGDVASSTA